MRRIKILNVAIYAILAAFLMATGVCRECLAEGITDRLLSGNSVISTNERTTSGDRAVKARILIMAPPSIVWDSVHKERSHDPDIEYSKVIERQDENKSTLEQKFVLLPIVGSATCLMSNDEIPLQRIDYRLLKSDRNFKAMDGSWVLSPYNDGRSTILELTVHLQLSFPIPQAIVDSFSARKLDKRLHNVKDTAETAEKVAQQDHHQG